MTTSGLPCSRPPPCLCLVPCRPLIVSRRQAVASMAALSCSTRTTSDAVVTSRGYGKPGENGEPFVPGLPRVLSAWCLMLRCVSMIGGVLVRASPVRLNIIAAKWHRGPMMMTSWTRGTSLTGPGHRECCHCRVLPHGALLAILGSCGSTYVRCRTCGWHYLLGLKVSW